MFKEENKEETFRGTTKMSDVNLKSQNKLGSLLQTISPEELKLNENQA